MNNFPIIIAIATFITLLNNGLLNAQIVNIEERRITGTNDSIRWYGHLNVNANLSKVKDQILQLGSTGQVQYKQDRSLFLLLLDGILLRAGGEDFNKAAFAHLRYNYKLSDPVVMEAYTQAQFNKLLLLELRWLAGLGPRFRLFKDEKGQNRIYAGMAYMYEYNQFLEGGGIARIHRLSNYISFTFRPWQGVKLVNTTYFQPQFTDWKNYRFSTEWRLDMPLGKRLSFTTDFTYSIDRSLPEGAPGSTYAWLNGLMFRLN